MATTSARAATRPVPRDDDGAARTPTAFSWEIIGIEHIPIKLIERNELNPRPLFHLPDSDPHIRSMADSLAADGQHSPAIVYELPDQPGHYRLLQGERRWRASRVAGRDTLHCLLTTPPSSRAHELAWLGIEEAHKLGWGTYFVLAHAKALADALGLPMTHPEIAAKTGIPRRDLDNGEAMFSLQPEIYALAAEYEQQLYTYRTEGRRGRLGKKALVNTGEFTVPKAALVYRLFRALRETMPSAVAQWDDVELQRRIAQKVVRGATYEHLEGLLAQLVDAAGHDVQGLITKVAELLVNEHRKIPTVLRDLGVTDHTRLTKMMPELERLDTRIGLLANNRTQLGTNPDQLRETTNRVLKLQRSLDRLLSACEARIDHLNRGGV